MFLGGDSDTPKISVKYLLDIYSDMNNGEMKGAQSIAVAQNRIDFLMQPDNYNTLRLLKNIIGVNKSNWTSEVVVNNIQYKVCLRRGLSFYHLLIHLSENYGDFYPCYNEDDFFISITNSTSEKIDFSTSKELADAFIFELYTTYNISMQYGTRPVYYEDEEDDVPELQKEYPIFPLIHGKGTNGAVQLFLKALDANDSDFEILCLSRIIEYISPTLIKNQLNSEVIQKLLSPRVFKPDAEYVAELGNIFSNHTRYEKSDIEMYKMTINAIVDLDEIGSIIPPFLSKQMKISLSNESREKLLMNIAQSISDTRNQIAHAKVNYRPKGMECPDQEKKEFVIMMYAIARQMIRWYESQPEEIRIG
jgi:hypothetical protein